MIFPFLSIFLQTLGNFGDRKPTLGNFGDRKQTLGNFGDIKLIFYL